MNWMAATGLALLLVSMGILAWVVPDAWRDGTEKGTPGAGEPASLDAMLRESRSGRHLRTRRLVFGAGTALLLTAVFLILQAPATIPTVNVQMVVPDTIIRTSGPPASTASVWSEAPFAISIALIVVLAVLGIVLFVRRNPAAGSASMIGALTLFSQLHLIKDLKVEIAPHFGFGSGSLTQLEIERIVDQRITSLKGTLIDDLHARLDALIANIDIKGVVDARIVEKIDLVNDLRQQIKLLIDHLELKIDKKVVQVHIDETTLKTQIDNYFLHAGGIGPEHLGYVVPEFDTGYADYKDSMKQSVEDICKNWHLRMDSTSITKGLVLAVGAADRVRLSAAAKVRYESNAGLARARAEAIKKKFVECGIPADQILAIVSGPRNTPALTKNSAWDTGYPEDRMVDVWVIWSWKTPRR
jgi:hypothetical protein